jgi:putative redox protein
MDTIRIDYKGNLRTECTHVKSGQVIVTDAPVDNNGKGEAFSPTDLVANAYVSCMLTIVGIYCNNNGLRFTKAQAGVEKVMGADPRRISGLGIWIDFAGNDWNEDEQKRVIAAAKACPVAKSVSADMDVKIDFKF